MPYQVSFEHPLEPADPEIYFNECCFGGDLVSDALRPEIERRYERLRANQEDWGWFLWFRQGTERLAVDIFCDDPAAGAYRLFLTARQPRRLRRALVVDTPELDALRDLVVERLTAWAGVAVTVVRLDDQYAPAGS